MTFASSWRRVGVTRSSRRERRGSSTGARRHQRLRPRGRSKTAGLDHRRAVAITVSQSEHRVGGCQDRITINNGRDLGLSWSTERVRWVATMPIGDLAVTRTRRTWRSHGGAVRGRGQQLAGRRRHAALHARRCGWLLAPRPAGGHRLVQRSAHHLRCGRRFTVLFPAFRPPAAARCVPHVATHALGERHRVLKPRLVPCEMDAVVVVVDPRLATPGEAAPPPQAAARIASPMTVAVTTPPRNKREE